MTSFDSILEFAHDDYIALDFRYTAMRFRQAAERAREYMNEPLWFKATVWAAESLYQMRDLRGALGLIITARAEEPPGDDLELARDAAVQHHDFRWGA